MYGFCRVVLMASHLWTDCLSDMDLASWGRLLLLQGGSTGCVLCIVHCKEDSIYCNVYCTVRIIYSTVHCTVQRGVYQNVYIKRVYRR